MDSQQQLQQYVMQHRQAGYPDKLISDTLMNAGWSQHAILQAMSSQTLDVYQQPLITDHKSQFLNSKGKYTPPIAVQLIIAIELLIIFVYTLIMLFTWRTNFAILYYTRSLSGLFMFIVIPNAIVYGKFFIAIKMRSRVKWGLVAYTVLNTINLLLAVYLLVTRVTEAADVIWLIQCLISSVLLAIVWTRNRNEFV